MHSYIAVIPARSGSKGIKDKNIMAYENQPLIVHSLRHALSSKLLDDYFLWTDSSHYFDIANKYLELNNIGLRDKYVDDDATDLMYLKDFLLRMNKYKFNMPDAIVLLRPTSPDRPKNLIDECIKEFDKSWEKYDSLRTVSKTKKTPYKMWFSNKDDDGFYYGKPLSKYLPGEDFSHSMPRQLLPDTFEHNGLIDIIKVETIEKLNCVAGEKVMLKEVRGNWRDIDSIEDLI